MEAVKKEADVELATMVLGSPSLHGLMVLGLNAVASMIDMLKCAARIARAQGHAARAGHPRTHGHELTTMSSRP